MIYLKKKNKDGWLRGKIWGSGGRIFAANVVLTTLVAGLFVGYLILNNLTTADGFTVRELEKKISTLKKDSDSLRLKVVGMQAMGSVEQEVNKLGFVPVSKFEYISAGPMIVAVK